MLKVIVGALIGIGGTFAGVWFTYFLTARRERVREDEVLKTALQTVVLELQGHRERLQDTREHEFLDDSAFQMLKMKGFLSRLPEDALKQLLAVYNLMASINQRINRYWERSDAHLASGSKGELLILGQWDREIKQKKRLVLDMLDQSVHSLEVIYKH